MKQAIETLMGTNAAVWMQAVRHTAAETMDEISASWDEPARPFARGFLIPRKAAAQVLRRATEGARLILVEGAPLASKSNVLREISLRSEQLNEFATLYVEAGVGGGILQSLALSRLPVLTGDALFVRSGNEFIPTERAQALASKVRIGLAALEEIFSEERPFDPGATAGRLTVAAVDSVGVLLMPRLVQALAREAPMITLQVRLPDPGKLREWLTEEADHRSPPYRPSAEG